MQKIVVINKARLTNGQHFAFMKDFGEFLQTVEVSVPKFTDTVAAFRVAFNKEDMSMKQERGSSLTKQLQEQDKVRDRTYGVLKRIVTAWSESGLETEAAAAEGLMKLVRLYNINPQSQMDEETGLLDNFIDDIKASATLSAAVDSLGVRVLFEAMVSANVEVRRILSERREADAVKVVGALKSARVEVDGLYEELLGLMEALAKLEAADGALSSRMAAWNVTVERYRTMLARKSTKDTPEEEGL